MAKPIVIEPDVSFVKSVLKAGGGDLKKCFQCGTCSVTCALSPDDGTFPRRQMIQAQWGLKEEVLNDPAIWLCHNCGDCTARCPRGAKPGEVFGALRSQAVAHFAWPGFMGKLVSGPAGLPVLVLIPVVLFAIFGALMRNWKHGAEHAAPGPQFADKFPLLPLEFFFFALSGLIILAFAVSVTRFLRGLRTSASPGAILSGLIPAAIEIMTHSRFAKCEAEKNRFWGHLLTFWGFVVLAGISTVEGFGVMFGVMQTPLPFWDPDKLLESGLKIGAHVAMVALLAGLFIILMDRLRNPAKRAATTYFDWFFLSLLISVVLTGMLSEGLRLAGMDPAMFVAYFIHLTLIFMLFAYTPYSKFAHIVYRTVAYAATRKS
jgi:quinone-modifying oxidoreductase subunit QmoC